MGPRCATGGCDVLFKDPLSFDRRCRNSAARKKKGPRLIRASTVQMLLSLSSAWLRARRYSLEAHLLLSAWVRIGCLSLQQNTMQEERHA